MQNDHFLPAGWTMSSIGDVATYLNGRAFKPSEWEELGLPIIRIQNLNDADAAYNYSTKIYEDRYVVKNGDLLFAWAASLGAFIWRGQDAWLNQHIFKVVPKIDKHFLYYLLLRTISEIYAKTHGSGMVHITKGVFEATPIALPPLAEQGRIVAKIEELFSKLDKGVESLTTAREHLDVFRLVVLHQTTSGQNGSPFPLKPLDELIGPIGQGWSPKCDVNTPAQDEEWAIIKTTAVQPMSYLPHECKPLPPDLQPRPGIAIQDGDLLMTRKGPRPRTGVVCYVKKARPRSMLCDTVYRFRALEKFVLPEYLEVALNSPSIVQEINARKSGISESGISLNHGKLRSLLIPVPEDFATQKRIVQTVGECLSEVEHATALLDDQVRRVGALRHSVLKRALSGRLLPQNNSDEPASVLLERICAGQETTKTRRNNMNGGKQAA
jgi:type I restriction enzyme S subunit